MNLLKCAVEVIDVSIYSISINKSVSCFRCCCCMFVSDSTLILYSSANFSKLQI